MRLDAEVLRYLSKNDFRVLTAVEMGMKNHELVPGRLIESIAKLRRGNCYKVIRGLLKHKLLAHEGGKNDGYKLTYNGYDFLALKAFVARGHIAGVGMRMGVGKESDIHICQGTDGRVMALKLHRLGRVSFRTIKHNRDYLNGRKSASWQYIARLAAKKEFAYMQALRDNGFPVPVPVDTNRHAVLMEFVHAVPLVHIREMPHPMRVLERLMRLLVRLVSAGLIHGDFNEFNLMIDENEKITMIDFPQVVSSDHASAKLYFDRDVKCIRDFFQKRFGVIVEQYPTFEEALSHAVKNENIKAADEEHDMPSKPIHIAALQKGEDALLDSVVAQERDTRLDASGASDSDGEDLDDDGERDFASEFGSSDGDCDQLQLKHGEFVSLAHVAGKADSDNESEVCEDTGELSAVDENETEDAEVSSKAEADGSDGSDCDDVDTAEAKVKLTFQRRTRKVQSADKAQKELRKKPQQSRGNKSKCADRKLRSARTECREAARDW